MATEKKKELNASTEKRGQCRAAADDDDDDDDDDRFAAVLRDQLPPRERLLSTPGGGSGNDLLAEDAPADVRVCGTQRGARHDVSGPSTNPSGAFASSSSSASPSTTMTSHLASLSSGPGSDFGSSSSSSSGSNGSSVTNGSTRSGQWSEGCSDGGSSLATTPSPSEHRTTTVNGDHHPLLAPVVMAYHLVRVAWREKDSRGAKGAALRGKRLGSGQGEHRRREME